MNNTMLKSITTPLVAGAFIISASTGLMIFFDFEPGIVEPVHEWMSWVLVSGALLHVLVNWSAFKSSLRRKTGGAFIVGAVAIALLSLYPWVEEGEDGRKKAVKSLEKASLVSVSGVLEAGVDQMLAKLAGNGVEVMDPENSLEEIAEQNDIEKKELFGIIFE
ncbi:MULTISPECIES: DUF4405 domain-containing protein [Prosthecochloris]|uniref:Flavinylation-associated cytochrome domain-containing protein n=1 Tax=Prosthecochloris marina TaxID=2017681 RepID=A0A317T8F2_9CHLB|nr:MULTISPECIES: DUF4405 domain-containing protein [Prosthecochloris]PWW82017.1 hypothetical protein CR164_06620 [Prosthecochloris marina]UZJ36682.1 DUF4405 domain-containing protein [Prosthecochloris sp. SCSIO W1103]UZJ39618.1 DUF4405 domain-containing protein [Prosthecochloris sp. SCSIO W1102]